MQSVENGLSKIEVLLFRRIKQLNTADIFHKLSR